MVTDSTYFVHFASGGKQSSNNVLAARDGNFHGIADSEKKNILIRELELSIEDSDYVRLHLEKTRFNFLV